MAAPICTGRLSSGDYSRLCRRSIVRTASTPWKTIRVKMCLACVGEDSLTTAAETAALLDCCYSMPTRQPLVEGGSQKRSQLPSVHVIVGRFAHGVVATGQHHDFVIESMALEFRHYIARKLWQKGQIVLRIND